MNDELKICESYINHVLPKTLNEMAPPTELGGSYEKPFDPTTLKSGGRGTPGVRDYVDKYAGIKDEDSQDEFVKFIIEKIKNGLLKAENKTFPGDFKAFRELLTNLITAVLKQLGGKVGGAGYIARLVQDYMVEHDIIRDERGGKSRGGSAPVKINASKLNALDDIDVTF